MLKPTIFREYDIRGIANDELLSPGIEQLGRAIGSYIGKKLGKKINVGRDVRLSSKRLRDAIVTGLVSSGCEVTDIGEVPTPLLYYSVQHLQCHGGVMITGSHNPAEYNGFKIMAGSGTIHGEEIQALRKMIDAADFDKGQGSVREFDIATPYVDEIASQFKFSRRLKVVLDAGNGVAGPVMRRVLDRLNVDAKELYFDMDGRFPNHHPDPTVEHNLDDLKKAVVQSRRGTRYSL